MKSSNLLNRPANNGTKAVVVILIYFYLYPTTLASLSSLTVRRDVSIHEFHCGRLYSIVTQFLENESADLSSSKRVHLSKVLPFIGTATGVFLCSFYLLTYLLQNRYRVCESFSAIAAALNIIGASALLAIMIVSLRLIPNFAGDLKNLGVTEENFSRFVKSCEIEIPALPAHAIRKLFRPHQWSGVTIAACVFITTINGLLFCLGISGLRSHCKNVPYFGFFRRRNTVPHGSWQDASNTHLNSLEHSVNSASISPTQVRVLSVAQNQQLMSPNSLHTPRHFNTWDLEDEKSSRNLREDSCSICLSDLSGGNAVRLPCAHKYHRNCIQKWLIRNNHPVCPLCKAEVPRRATV